MTQQQQHCCSLLGLRNNANDSVMSLAAAHGHAGMVKLLLLHTETAVVADDLHKAQGALHKTKRLQQQIVQRRPESVAAATLAQVETKARQIQQCIQLLTAVLQERADALAAELTSGLLIDEPTNNKSNAIRKSNGSKNRKNKRKNNNKTNRVRPSSTHRNNKEEEEEYPRNPDRTDSPAQDCLQLTQLANGNRAIVVINSKSDNDDNNKEHDQSTETAIASGTTPSIQKLVDKDTLAALCLDPSHLLLSAHGMALHLSAAQLDCIQGILEGQLQAVATARHIQNRMHQTATNHHGLQQQKQSEEG